MKAITGFISAVLSQIVIGLIIGMLWNYSIAPLGLPTLPMTHACAIWMLIALITVVLTYVSTNVVMVVIEYYRKLQLAETIEALAIINKDDNKSEED